MLSLVFSKNANKHKALKNYASILVFLEQNNIDSTQKAIDSLDNRFELWNEYLALRPFMEKYRKLENSDKKIIYSKHTAKIERYKTLNDHFTNMRDNGVTLKPNNSHPLPRKKSLTDDCSCSVLAWNKVV